MTMRLDYGADGKAANLEPSNTGHVAQTCRARVLCGQKDVREQCCNIVGPRYFIRETSRGSIPSVSMSLL